MAPSASNFLVSHSDTGIFEPHTYQSPLPPQAISSSCIPFHLPDWCLPKHVCNIYSGSQPFSTPLTDSWEIFLKTGLPHPPPSSFIQFQAAPLLPPTPSSSRPPHREAFMSNLLPPLPLPPPSLPQVLSKAEAFGIDNLLNDSPLGELEKREKETRSFMTFSSASPQRCCTRDSC